MLRDRGLLDADWRLNARVVSGAVPGSLSAPLVTNLQLTRACNLRCEHCFVDVEARPHPGELSLEQLERLFGELQAAGSPLILFAGGEPMMRRDFWPIVEASQRADLDVALCTNATFITDSNAARLASSGIRWFSVSLDGADAETHDKVRGKGSFERAVRGVRALMRAGAPGVKLRVTVSQVNATRLLDFAPLAEELGVPEVVFKPFRHTTGGEALTSLHLYLSHAEYEQAVEAVRQGWPESAPRVLCDDGMPESLPAWTKVTPEFGCVGGTTHASVLYDGRVVACDAVQDPRDWTLHRRGFLESWLGAPTVASWRRLKDSGDCSACSNFTRCGGGCRARALASGGTMADPDPWAYCEDKRDDPRDRAPRRAS